MFKRKKKQVSVKAAPAKPAGNNIIESVAKLKTSQGNLEKRVNFLRKKANRHLTLAKQANSQGNKDDALLNLRRKKVYEKEIKTLEASILTIEEQTLKIEGASAVQDVYGALQIAKNTMAAVTKGMDPEKLQDLMADIEDANADFDEVQNILGENAIMEMEDPDLLAELEELDSDQVEEKAFDLRLPEVTNKEDELLLKELRRDTAELEELEMLVAPTHTPVVNKPKPVTNTAEEEELAQLAQLLV